LPGVPVGRPAEVTAQPSFLLVLSAAVLVLVLETSLVTATGSSVPILIPYQMIAQPFDYEHRFTEHEHRCAEHERERETNRFDRQRVYPLGVAVLTRCQEDHQRTDHGSRGNQSSHLGCSPTPLVGFHQASLSAPGAQWRGVCALAESESYDWFGVLRLLSLGFHKRIQNSRFVSVTVRFESGIMIPSHHFLHLEDVGRGFTSWVPEARE
jgi:hypothetical protein